MTRIGVVTIGRSPREDVVAAMFAGNPPPGLLQAGALDTLDDAAVAKLVPADGESPLVTRVAPGQEVVIAETRILRHLQAALDRLVTRGAEIIVILCTGEFPSLVSPVPIVFPDRVLRGVVDALLPTGTLGVLMPHAGQRDLMDRKWSAPGRQIVHAAGSPYTDASALADHAAHLTELGAQLIVMDCMGYDGAMKRAVTSGSGLPTVLANRMVGRVVEEIAG